MKTTYILQSAVPASDLSGTYHRVGQLPELVVRESSCSPCRCLRQQCRPLQIMSTVEDSSGLGTNVLPASRRTNVSPGCDHQPLANVEGLCKVDVEEGSQYRYIGLRPEHIRSSSFGLRHDE